MYTSCGVTKKFWPCWQQTALLLLLLLLLLSGISSGAAKLCYGGCAVSARTCSCRGTASPIETTTAQPNRLGQVKTVVQYDERLAQHRSTYKSQLQQHGCCSMDIQHLGQTSTKAGQAGPPGDIQASTTQHFLDVVHCQPHRTSTGCSTTHKVSADHVHCIQVAMRFLKGTADELCELTATKTAPGPWSLHVLTLPALKMCSQQPPGAESIATTWALVPGTIQARPV